MWYVYTVAIVTAILGFAAGWTPIRRGRRPTPLDDIQLQWESRPRSLWSLSWAHGFYTTWHSLSVLALGALFFLSMAGDPARLTLPLLEHLPAEWRSGVELPVAISAGMVGAIMGATLAFPVATRLVQPVRMAITPAGAAYGGYLFLWDGFSHFIADPVIRSLHFYPRRAPAIPNMAWQPPDGETFDQAAALLGQYLPASPPTGPIPWQRGAPALLGALLVITLPFLVIGWRMYALAVPWAWLYDALAVWAVFAAGGVVLKHYGA